MKLLIWSRPCAMANNIDGGWKCIAFVLTGQFKEIMLAMRCASFALILSERYHHFIEDKQVLLSVVYGT